MKVKTAQVLQIIATVLYLLSFIACIVSIFFQQEIKGLFAQDPAVINCRSVPYASLIISLVFLLLAVIYLILVLSIRSRGGSIAAVIIMAFLVIVIWIGMETVGSVFVNCMVAAEGATALASYSVLENAVRMGTEVLMIPATALMFLSMGGFCGKPFKEKAAKKKEQAAPAPERKENKETIVTDATVPFPSEEITEPVAVEISVIPETAPEVLPEVEENVQAAVSGKVPETTVEVEMREAFPEGSAPEA